MVRHMPRQDHHAELAGGQRATGASFQEFTAAVLQKGVMGDGGSSPFPLQFASIHLEVPRLEFELALVNNDLLETGDKGLRKGPNSFFSKITKELKGCCRCQSPDVPGDGMQSPTAGVLRYGVKRYLRFSVQGFLELFPLGGE